MLILAVAGLGTWIGLSGSSGHAGASGTISHKPAPIALMNALILANNSSEAKGLLPPSTCKQDTPTHVTCTAPAPGISAAVFQKYPDQKALYAAYMAKVSALNSGQFKQNFKDCGFQNTYGEVSWNHQRRHNLAYTVDQMETVGAVTDDQAAGRVFCTYTNGLEYMVWTQNDGHLMGYVSGPLHADVWNWWVPVHHNVGLTGVAQPGWELSGDSLYASQQVGAAVDRSGRIWVAGGLTDAQDATAKTEFYDPTIGTWSPGPNLPVPLHHAMMVSYRNTVWVIGGFEPRGSEIIRGRLRPGAVPKPGRKCLGRGPCAAPCAWRRRGGGGGEQDRRGRRADRRHFPAGCRDHRGLRRYQLARRRAAFRFRAITWRPRRTARTCTPSAGAG